METFIGSPGLNEYFVHAQHCCIYECTEEVFLKHGRFIPWRFFDWSRRNLSSATGTNGWAARKWYTRQENEICLPDGSVIAFRYAEYEKDVDDFLGPDFMDIMIDEAAPVSGATIQKFFGLNRWPASPRATQDAPDREPRRAGPRMPELALHSV